MLRESERKMYDFALPDANYKCIKILVVNCFYKFLKQFVIFLNMCHQYEGLFSLYVCIYVCYVQININ